MRTSLIAIYFIPSGRKQLLLDILMLPLFFAISCFDSRLVFISENRRLIESTVDEIHVKLMNGLHKKQYLIVKQFVKHLANSCRETKLRKEIKRPPITSSAILIFNFLISSTPNTKKNTNVQIQYDFFVHPDTHTVWKYTSPQPFTANWTVTLIDVFNISLTASFSAKTPEENLFNRSISYTNDFPTTQRWVY